MTDSLNHITSARKDEGILMRTFWGAQRNTFGFNPIFFLTIKIESWLLLIMTHIHSREIWSLQETKKSYAANQRAYTTNWKLPHLGTKEKNIEKFHKNWSWLRLDATATATVWALYTKKTNKGKIRDKDA